MDITDLIDSHAVIYRTIADSSHWYENLVIFDFVPSSSRQAFTSMIQINSLTSYTANQRIFDVIFYNSDVTNYCGCRLEVVSHTTTYVTARLRCYVQGLSDVVGASFNLLYGTTYAVYIELISAASVNKQVDACIGYACNFDTTTRAENRLFAYNTASVTQSNAGLSAPAMSKVYVRSGHWTYYFSGDVRFYETYNHPILASDLSSPTGPYFLMIDHLILGARRLIYATYGDTDWATPYLLAPKYIFDGSPYDMTDILYTYIESLETDISVLEADVAILNSALIMTNDYEDHEGVLVTWWSNNQPGWWSSVPKTFKNIVLTMIDIIDQFYEKVIVDFLNNAEHGLVAIKTKAQSAVDDFLNNETYGLSVIKEKANDIFTSATSAINDYLNDAEKGLLAIKNKAVDTYNKTTSAIDDYLADAVNGLGAIKTKVVDVFSDLDGLLDEGKLFASNVISDIFTKFKTYIVAQIATVMTNFFNESEYFIL